MFLKVFCDSFDALSDSVSDDKQQESSTSQIFRKRIIEGDLVYSWITCTHQIQ